MVIAVIFVTVVAMLVVIVRRRRLRRVIRCNGAVAVVLAVVRVGEALVLITRAVGQLPQLGSPSGFPHRLHNLFLVCVPGHRHLLHVHVYVHAVHA